jgi:hypothetical protein
MSWCIGNTNHLLSGTIALRLGMSMQNTRLSRCTQRIAACFGVIVKASFERSPLYRSGEPAACETRAAPARD